MKNEREEEERQCSTQTLPVGLHVNCFYNNLVTGTRNSAANDSSQPHRLLVPRPLPAPILSAGVAASHCVATGLQRFDTQNFRVRFLSNIKDVWGLSFQENTGSRECFRRGPCLIEEVGRWRVDSGVAEHSGPKPRPPSFSPHFFLASICS